MTDTSNYYPQPGMDLSHVNDVMNQYIQSKQKQQNGGLLQQILSNRMQPQDQDIMTAGLREAQSYASPGGFKAYSPEGQMADRITNQLSPYSDALKLANQEETLSGNQMDNQIKAQTGLPAAMAELKQRQMHNDVYGKTGLPQAMADLQMAQTNAKYADPEAQAKIALMNAQAKESATGGAAGMGGATGVLAQRLMAEAAAAGRPITLAQALYTVQTGMRQGTQLDNTGNVAPIPGVPQAKGDIKKGEAIGQKVGEGLGTATANLQEDTATLPQLEDTVHQLNELGKTATYTWAGNLKNQAMRQSGMAMPQGAIDQAAYISMVDNQVLPLLRRTFGAQFTEREGATLRATLGDVNRAPEEKSAILDSFIKQKIATIGSLQRQTGQTGGQADPLGIR